MSEEPMAASLPYLSDPRIRGSLHASMTISRLSVSSRLTAFRHETDSHKLVGAKLRDSHPQHVVAHAVFGAGAAYQELRLLHRIARLQHDTQFLGAHRHHFFDCTPPRVRAG